MFWRVASITHTSAVEAILDKGVGSFTLEELLEEDDLIQVGSYLRIVFVGTMLVIEDLNACMKYS